MTRNVNLTWGSVNGALGYNIYRADSASGPWTYISSSATTSHTDSVESGHTYYYKVSAFGDFGQSADSEILTVNVIVCGPSEANTVSEECLTATISWSSVDGATGYNVYRNDVLLQNNVPSSPITDSPVPSPGNWCYFVTALGAWGESAASPTSCVDVADCPPPSAEEDMSLEQAIYSASQDKIYGVRGQWVHQFNATTGVRENSFRFVEGVLGGEASIVELGGQLYISAWRGRIEDQQHGIPAGDFSQPTRDIYGVDYALTTSTALGLPAFFATSVSSFEDGPELLQTDGTFLFFNWQNYEGHCMVDPTNVAGTFDVVSYESFVNRETTSDLYYDAFNQLLWVALASERNVWVFDTVPGQSAWDSFNSVRTTPFNSMATPAMGITYSVVNTSAYAVTGRKELLKIATPARSGPPFLDPPTFSTIDLSSLDGSLVAITPIRIRYNSVNDLLYIPTWNDDRIVIYNPVTDLISSIVTGFDTPVDVVFTPTKAFAVQNSATGLKEIV